eukprot:1157305-Pelagomonas_calceolata.AAC.22
MAEKQREHMFRTGSKAKGVHTYRTGNHSHHAHMNEFPARIQRAPTITYGTCQKYLWYVLTLTSSTLYKIAHLHGSCHACALQQRHNSGTTGNTQQHAHACMPLATHNSTYACMPLATHVSRHACFPLTSNNSIMHASR